MGCTVSRGHRKWKVSADYSGLKILPFEQVKLSDLLV